MQPDSSIQNRIAAIRTQNNEVQNKAKAVQALQTQLKSQIDEMYRRVMADLENCINHKVSIILHLFVM
jgi:molecular chaperone GrpE (heat shock protein)